MGTILPPRLAVLDFYCEILYALFQQFRRNPNETVRCRPYDHSSCHPNPSADSLQLERRAHPRGDARGELSGSFSAVSNRSCSSESYVCSATSRSSSRAAEGASRRNGHL